MSPSPVLYPATPVNVPSSVTEPSPAFKKEVSRVMGSVLLFFVVYIILIILAIGLAMAAVYGGIALIVAIPRLITIMVGIGLVGLGVMVLFFLIKFIFAVSRFDRSGSIEIKEKDHPKLFAFIHQLTRDTQTPFPKRIYLSPEVNACVFYDSSFWSMFLPVKKNLQIGLGLVNSVNLSEFKAVMAHEFGHFSQRSMKLGSFVYNVNRVIYNMLYENNGYGRFLQNWANVSSYFAFFAGLTVRIVNGIQWVLQKMYGFINKNYMGLSREMEFHADAVAASVSGSQNCVNALRRIELAGSCYNVVIRKCDEWYKQNYVITNLYLNQQTVFKQYAEDFKLNLQQHLPVVTQEFMKNNQLNRVNFKDQWASHPTMEEREENLDRLHVVADTEQDSAWVLFEDPAYWQQQLTDKIYVNVTLPADIQKLDKEAFDKKFWQEVHLFTLPEVYKSFYDGREITLLDIEALSNEAPVRSGISPEELFSAEHTALPKKIAATATDLQLLKSIAAKAADSTTFDFDGGKYTSDKAPGFIQQLETELKAMQEELVALDRQTYQYFYHRILAQDGTKAFRLKTAYINYFAYREKSQQYLDEVNQMLRMLDPLFTGQQLTAGIVRDIISDLKGKHEQPFKDQLQYWLTEGAFNDNSVLKQRIEKFIESRYSYFSGETFFTQEFQDLNELANEGWRMITVLLFKKFKHILEMQLEMTG